MLLKDFAPLYLELHNDNKPASLEKKQGILRRQIIPVFGAKEMDDITKLDVDLFTARLRNKEKLSNKTINNHLTVLRNLLKRAMEYQYVRKMPTIQAQRNADFDRQFLSREQAERLVAQLERQPMWQAMVIFGLNTGLRIGELRGLRWKDVRLQTETPQVTVKNAFSGRGNVLGTPKNHKSRTLPLNKAAVAALQSLNGGAEFVFAQPKVPGQAPTFLSYKACDFRIRQARAVLRMPWLSWHTLRHSFASDLAMSGKVTILEIKELLGHSDIKVTMRYAHLMPSTLVRAVSVLDSK